MAKRIQLRRTKGYRKPADAVNVARPTKWGNPFKVGTPYPDGDPIELQHPMTRWEAVWMFHDYARRLLIEKPTWDVSELRGKDLACWCPLDQPCHADVLLELANA